MDYDSARHHYESLQTAKKKDEVKIAKVGAGEGPGQCSGRQNWGRGGGGGGDGDVCRHQGATLLGCTYLPLCTLALTLPWGWECSSPFMEKFATVTSTRSQSWGG